MLEQRLRWDLQEEVGNWAVQTFPKATTKSIIAHIKKEIKELEDASDDGLSEECADIYMMLLHIAHRQRFDLFLAAKNKLEINKRRKWGLPDKDGVVEHIR